MMISHCKHCETKIVRRGSRPGVYCSLECKRAGYRTLPPDEVIVAAYRSGMSCGEIAERYGCKAQSVQSLLTRAREPRRGLSEAAKLVGDRGRARGRFPKRNVPWNKGLKGTHFSPETEFKPGHNGNLRFPIGTVRVRIRQRSGKLHEAHAYVKVAQPNVWKLRCHVNWEKRHGPIPKGMLIHHRDEDAMEDKLSNLALVTRAEHLAIHRPEFEARRAARAGSKARERWAKYRQGRALAAGLSG